MTRFKLTTLCIAAAAAACSEGYPDAEPIGVPLRAPSAPADLISSLQGIADEETGAGTWKYHLTDPCELTISRHEAPGETENVRLPGKWIYIRPSDGDGFGVTLDPLDDASKPEVVVISALKWRDASHAATLVQRLIAQCKSTAA